MLLNDLVPKNPYDIAVSFRWAAMEEVDRSSVDAFPTIFAKDVQSYLTLATKINCPNLSALVISVRPTQKEDIGFASTGTFPIRKRPNKEPVPGWNDDYEWLGLLTAEEKPQKLNPLKGYLVTANNL